MKILVTGGAGFIGCNFVYYMLDKYSDYKIVCLDALTYAGNLRSLDKATENPNFKFIKGSIADKELVNRIFEEEKFDAVFNGSVDAVFMCGYREYVSRRCFTKIKRRYEGR